MAEPRYSSHGAVDDFLRSFLGRFGLCRTLRSFEAEWYGALRTAALPDACTHRRELQRKLQGACEEAGRLRGEVDRLRGEADRLQGEVLRASRSLVMVQRDRDFHQLQYGQDCNHKNTVIEDIKLLKKDIKSYEPELQQMKNKYQDALGKKMLISIEKDIIQSSKGIKETRE